MSTYYSVCLLNLSQLTPAPCHYPPFDASAKKSDHGLVLLEPLSIERCAMVCAIVCQFKRIDLVRFVHSFGHQVHPMKISFPRFHETSLVTFCRTRCTLQPMWGFLELCHRPPGSDVLSQIYEWHCCTGCTKSLSDNQAEAWQPDFRKTCKWDWQG